MESANVGTGVRCYRRRKAGVVLPEHAENSFTLSINGMATHQSIAHHSIDDRSRNDSMTLTADPLTFFT